MRKELIVLIGGLLVLALIIVFLTPEQDPAPPLVEGGDEEVLDFGLPNGFTATLFTDSVPGVRVLAHDSKGTLVASLMSKGSIVALPNQDGNYRVDEVITVLEGLSKPHGIAFIGNTLYVAEEGAVKSYAYNPDTFSANYLETLTLLPTGGGHTSRSLIATADNTHLLVSIGSSCNVCVEEDTRRAALLAINLETKQVASFATGLRNTVFMALHPTTGALWGADMGRDWLGDDLPPDEINIIKQGGNYGWPICYGKNVHDTQFDTNTYIRNPCTEPFETPSHIDLQAHSAPLGIAFVPPEGWPQEWHHDLLVAYHGSWNRSIPTGYKIVRIPLSADGSPMGAPVDFMTGFITERGVIGRPAALITDSSGVLWVSDDEAGAIYRIAPTAN